MYVCSRRSNWVLCGRVPVQVEATEARIAGAAESLDSARTKESELLQQRAVLDKELLATKRREEQLVKKVST
jgi:hypothetical protein